MIWFTDGTPAPAWLTDGTQVWGSTDDGPVVPPVGPTRNVASLCTAATIAAAPAVKVGTFAATLHTLAVDVIDPYLEWVITPGFIKPTSGGVLRVAVQAGSGPVRSVTFAGAASHRLDPAVGTSVVITSDPVTLSAHAGTVLRILAWVAPDDEGGVPADATSLLTTDPGAGGGPWQTTPSLSPTTTQGAGVSGGPSWTLRPSRVIAPSDVDAWVAVGDSIVQQTWSWPERALAPRPAVKSGVGGDAYIYHGAGSTFPNRVGAHLGYAGWVLDEFGINDTGTAQDPLVIATRALAFWRQVRDAGARIVKSTLTLNASSSDDWSTLEGQTPAATEPGRAAFNTWLRDGAPLAPDGTAPAPAGTADAIRCTTISPGGIMTARDEGHPLNAVTDVVAAIESSPDSGKYALGAPATAMQGWADGLHPSPGIHAILGDRLARDLELLGF